MLVYQAVATSSDGAAVTYAESGGDDRNLLTLDSQTGELRFTAEADFENPRDTDGDNIYEVEIQASNGTETARQLVRITVEDRAQDDGFRLIDCAALGGCLADAQINSVRADFWPVGDVDGDGTPDLLIKREPVSTGGGFAQFGPVLLQGAQITLDGRLVEYYSRGQIVIDFTPDNADVLDTRTDLSGDGTPDLVFFIPGPGPSISGGTATAAFSETLGLTGGADVDLATLGTNQGISFSPRNTDGSFVDDFHPADFDGDGVPGALVCMDRPSPAADEFFAIFDEAVPWTTASDINVDALPVGSAVRLTGLTTQDEFGEFLCDTVPDMDGDGADEALIWVPTRSTGESFAVRAEGEIFLVMSSAIQGDADGVIDVAAPVAGSVIRIWNSNVFVFQSRRFNTFIEPLDDIDGDGIGDLFIAFRDPDIGQQGTIVRGAALIADADGEINLRNLDAASQVLLMDNTRVDEQVFGEFDFRALPFFSDADSSGDLNGDGINDILIGPFDARNQPRNDQAIDSRVFVLFGRDLSGVTEIDLTDLSGGDGLEMRFDELVRTTFDVDYFSRAGRFLGDLNGDGYDEIGFLRFGGEIFVFDGAELAELAENDVVQVDLNDFLPQEF